MTGTQLIALFEQYVDDSSELSSDEELTLLNKIYHQVLDSRPWEFLKKEWTGTTTALNYIALPTDFKYFFATQNYTDSSMGAAPGKVVYVNNEEYPVVNWSDRRQYVGSKSCYVDMVNKRLYFTNTPGAGLSISADYIYSPDDITASTEPVIPETYQPMLYHGMAVDDMIIQLFDKARSYAPENQAKYDNYMRSLAYWNSNLINL